MTCEKFVSYEDFGAVGDGKTNDYYAIKRAHEYANEHHLPVITDSSKTYYVSETRIDGVPTTVEVKTNVNFGDSHFIIDDSAYVPGDDTKVTSKNIFNVISDYPVESITDREALSRLDGIGEGTEKLDLALGYPAMIIVYDENKHVYGRAVGVIELDTYCKCVALVEKDRVTEGNCVKTGFCCGAYDGGGEKGSTVHCCEVGNVLIDLDSVLNVCAVKTEHYCVKSLLRVCAYLVCVCKVNVVVGAK